MSDTTIDGLGELVSPATTTLVPVLAAGASVAQRATLNNVAPAVAAGSAGFVPSGTGATARSIRDKLRDGLDPADYGAIGDGVADDRAALQACINEAAGRPILGRDKTYRITAALTYSGPVNFQGVGNGAGPGGAEQDGQPATRIWCDFANPTAFNITNTTRPSIFRDFMINVAPAYRSSTSGAGISISPGSGTATNANTKIEGVAFNNLFRGIYAMKPAWWTIAGCYFGTWVRDAIFTETDGSAEASTGWVRGNFFFGNSDIAQRSCIYLGNGYAIIEHNEILGAQHGIFVNAANFPAGFVKIVGNTIEENYYYGVRISATGTTAVTMVDVSENEFSSVATASTYLNSIFVDDAPARLYLQDLTIARNIMRHNGSVANGYIQVGAGQNVIVSGNVGEQLSGSAASLINVNGAANNDCLGPPVQVLDNSTLGTFTARYLLASAANATVRDQVPITVAQLPTFCREGSMLFCSDGRSTSSSDLTVRNGGTGALVVRQGSAWRTPGFIP